MIKQLKAITTQTGDALAMPVNPSNIGEVIAKINQLTSLPGSSSYAVALAEMLYNQKLQQLAEDSTWTLLPATDKKLIFKGRSRTEAFYMTLTERQNKALVHGLESLRAMLHQNIY